MLRKCRRLLKSKYQKAKEKWFDENILEFEIFFYDATHNERIVEYDICQGLILEYPMFSAEGKSLFSEIVDLEAWEIYFKYRLKFQSKNLYKHSLRFNETRKVNIC